MNTNFTKEQIAEIYSGWFKRMIDQGRNQNEFLPVLIRLTRIRFGIDEEWRDIKGYEGYYQVSNFGRVKSLDRKAWNGKVWHDKLGRILASRLDGVGYIRNQLCINGEQESPGVHRLVGKCFIQNPNNLPIINHRDAIKNNNFYINLEWCDQSYNNLHAYKNGLREAPRAMIGKSGKDSPTSKVVCQLTKDNHLIAEYFGAAEACRHTGIHYSAISKCCKGYHKTAGGFKWKFKKDYYGAN